VALLSYWREEHNQTEDLLIAALISFVQFGTNKTNFTNEMETTN